MTLYHFTAKRFLSSIKKEGISRGMMLKSLRPIQMIPRKQWLTKNSDFNQGWSIGTGLLPYKRNEVRLTIEIPDDDDRIQPWTKLKFLVPEVANYLEASDLADPENWMIYDGVIPSAWILKIDFHKDQS